MLKWFYGQKEEEKEPQPELSGDPMVHRPSDSRLLSNLISHEKDYSKQLQSLLDSSHASLASLSAFAAAAGQPVSRVLTSISGEFSSADDAFRRYKDAVDAWREQLKTLKDMETEVSTIMRDREILVTRLLKASKNEKPPKDKGNNRRSSILGQRAPSTSSLSLSLDHSYAPSTSVPTSNKLAAAQAELQACEAHLANKETELEGARITALRDGLRIRCNALVECGMSWAELGRDALHATESLPVHTGELYGTNNSQNPYSAPQQTPQKALPLHMRAETGSDRGYRLPSDNSSIGPSQSASQVNIIIDHRNTANPSIIPNAPNPILGANGSDIHRKPSSDIVARPNSTPPLPPPIRASSPFSMPAHRSSSVTNLAYAEQRPTTTYNTSQIDVPPAHAIRDGEVPTVTPAAGPSKPEPRRTGSGYITPVSNDESSRSNLEAPTGYRDTQIPEELDVESDGEGPDLSKERQLIKDGKLTVVENPRYQQPPTVSEPLNSNAAPPEQVEMPVPDPAPVSAPPPVHSTATDPDISAPASTSAPPPVSAPAHAIGATSAPQAVIDGPSSQDAPVTGVREIRRESELPEPPTEQPPGVPSSVPTGEPQTPQKSRTRVGTPSPQKSGFLGSLKKVFGGGSRDSNQSPLDKAREKREKVREKEMKDREKKEKAREREFRREEKKDERARMKKKQKQDEHLSRLVPDSSEEDEVMVDDDSLRRYRKGVKSSKLTVGGGKADKFSSGADRKASEPLRGEVEALPETEVIDGYVMKKNTDLYRNLKGGVLEAKRERRQGRGRVRSDAGEFVGMDSGRYGGASQGGTFVVERGAKVSRSSSVPPRTAYASPPRTSGERNTTLGPTAGSSMVPSAPTALPRTTTDTRFHEELNSQNGTSVKFQPQPTVARNAAKERGYTSDTSALPSSTSRIDGLPAAPAVVTASGAIIVPSATRKASKRRSAMPQLGGSQGADVARHGSVLSNATAPAGMSTGPGGRRGSVGASVVTPQVASGARRAVSIDYGQPSRAGPSSSRSPVISGPSPPSQGPQESLMSIVNSVTNTNRRAWDTGLAESKMDRESGGRSTFLGPVPSGSGNYVAPEGHARDRVVAGRGSMDGASYTGSEKMGGVVKAPPRMDRQALMTSLKASPGSQGRAYQTTMQTSSVTQEKRPLKSAMRASRSPSPDAMHGGRVHAHGYSTETGKDRIVPMAAVPSASSLPTDGPPPPVQRVRGIGDNVAEYGREEEEDGYESPSSSSYETGHEDFDYEEVARPKRRKSSGLAAAPSASHTSQTGLRKVEYFDRRPGLGSPPLAVSSPHPPAQMSSDNPPQYGSFTPVSTPSRRKSVRVSLNPTFSPTPPAIEDEDDEDNRAPYVFREAPAPSTSVPPPVKQVPRNYGTQRTSRQTTWDDDSDDDVEYKRAKEMLAKAGRGY